jgi:hypothetical protein
VEDVAADLISRARAGDGEAFRELTEPYRRELQVHCYRMLGSFQDAEDALQDTLLGAWQGFGGFEGRASPRWGPCMQISGPQPVIAAGHSAAVCSTPGLPAFPDRPCGDAQSYEGIDGPPGRP